MGELTVDSNIKDVARNSWYSLKLNRNVSSPRAGHTAIYLQKEHKVVLIGGATINMLYNEVFILDLLTLSCDILEPAEDFKARYEHSAFLSVDGSAIYVYGGANLKENWNDLWQFHVQDKKWTKLSQNGDIPTPRTYHTTSALGNKMILFGGGAKSLEAVDDEKVYQLDLDNNKWSIVPTKGENPKPRQGHAIVAVDDKLFLHGGMTGNYLFDDLNILEADGTWVQVESSDKQPTARAAHGAVFHNGYIYIFGGLGHNLAALNDMWRLHTDTLVWQQMETSGISPSSRLDCTMVVVNLPQTFIKEGDKEKAETVEQRPFIMLHGGLDETGKVFDDFHVFSL